MYKVGNKKANFYYENQLGCNFKRPSWDNNDDVASFIRDKYVNKRWMMKAKENSETEKNKSETKQEPLKLPTFDLIPLA